MSESLIQSLAEKHGKSPAQVLLRWHIQQGHIVIPGSKKGFPLSRESIWAMSSSVSAKSNRLMF